jgi:hypothetical protein
MERTERIMSIGIPVSKISEELQEIIERMIMFKIPIENIQLITRLPLKIIERIKDEINPDQIINFYDKNIREIYRLEERLLEAVETKDDIIIQFAKEDLYPEYVSLCAETEQSNLILINQKLVHFFGQNNS